MFSTRTLSLLLGALLAVLSLAALLLPAHLVDRLFAEGGPVEMASVVGWLLCVLLVLVRAWVPRGTGLAYMVVFLGLADRESDFLREHFGIQMSRTARQLLHLQDWPSGRQLLVALLILVLLVAFLVAAWSALRFLFARGGLGQYCGQLLLLAGVLLVASQGAEALHNALPASSVGARMLYALSLALEEGMELAGALCVLLSLLAHPRGGGYLKPA